MTRSLTNEGSRRAHQFVPSCRQGARLIRSRLALLPSAMSESASNRDLTSDISFAGCLSMVSQTLGSFYVSLSGHRFSRGAVLAAAPALILVLMDSRSRRAGFA